MFIYTIKDIIGFGLIALFILFFAGAFLLEKILFFLEDKKIITSKWREK